MTEVDILVVGGGINGVGIARDAAGRGLSVCLCEQHDLASHTSSASTKLIHGGLRYLEQYEFALVGKALSERRILLEAVPHIAWPLRFVLPHQPHLRPAWMIRLGLFLYDHLSRQRSLPGSRRISLRDGCIGAPLRKDYPVGFVYSDAWVQDSRLVVLNAMDAQRRGASILTRTRCIQATRGDQHWTATLAPENGAPIDVKARALVNVSGPWATQFLDEVAHAKHQHNLRLIKGSHIVVPALFEHDHAYIFQQPDRRIVFAIPYEGKYTLIGTTDVEFHDDPSDPKISDDELDYLCEAANRYFEKQISPADVVWSYSGVRPLVGDEHGNASDVTRDYHLSVDRRGALLLNVFGGKLTTFRRLGEDAMDRLAPALGSQVKAWTGKGHPLPGGERKDIAALIEEVHQRYAFLPEATVRRLVRAYGTLTFEVLGDAGNMQALGEHFGADLYAREVDYLHRAEWARCTEDILWRRSKLGLAFNEEQTQGLAAYLKTLSA